MPQQRWSSISVQACLLYYRCRRVLSKAQLAGIQSPDPDVQTGLRIISLTPTSGLVLWGLRG